MTEKRISIDLVFDEQVDEDFPEDAPWYDLTKVSMSYSNIHPVAREGIAEHLGQSDMAYVDLPNAIIEAIATECEVGFK